MMLYRGLALWCCIGIRVSVMVLYRKLGCCTGD